MTKKRVLSLMLAGVLAVSMMTACGGGSSDKGGSDKQTTAAANSGSEGGQAASDDDIRISFVMKTLASEHWQFMKSGAEKAAEDLGVTVEIKGPPSETSYDEQMNMIQTDLGSGGYDGYIIAPLQADTVKTLIADTDAPVMALDSAIPSDKVISFIGTGNEEAAKAGKF